MVTYRHFRNPDPPALVRVWNDGMTGRGAVHLRHSTLLEFQVFAKPYFDPKGLILAEDGDKVIGFAHGGFGACEDKTALCRDTGIVCMVVVHPAYRRQGVGSELLRRCEEYLRNQGANKLLAGSCAPQAPFYQQVYGGCNLPGFLESNELAEPFLQHHDYTSHSETLVLHRELSKPPTLADARFSALRNRYDIFVDAMRARPTWWQNCELAVTDPMEFTLQQGEQGTPHAVALVVQLDGFPWAHNGDAVGILDIEVQPDARRQGLAKYLVTQLLHFLQEQQFYQTVEVQVSQTDEAAKSLFLGLDFQQVDIGKVYLKNQ